MPRSGIAAAWAARPRYVTSTSAMHTQGMFTRLRAEGCIINAASTPSKAPRRAISSLPPPRSSAGVPRTRTLPGGPFGRLARARPAPTLAVAIRLCPQAWPISGSASYSASSATRAPPSVAELRLEGRLEAVGPGDDLEPGPSHEVGEQGGGLALLEGQLRVRVDGAGEVEQLRPHGVDGVARFLLQPRGVHARLRIGDCAGTQFTARRV